MDDDSGDPAGSSRAGGVGVTVRGLTVRYGSLVAVDAVDLTVAPGEVLGIIGPNGAGKTSLLECVEGLRRPSSGQVAVAGLDPATARRELAELVGVQPQHSTFPTRARVAEVCRLFTSFYRQPADYRVLLEQFGLAAASRQLVSKLSGGQQQRLSLVLALLGRPQIVFLDELTTGLDPAARRSVWEGLRARNEQGLTVVITSHHMEEVEYLCDRVAVLAAGRVVAQDSVSALIREHTGDTERLVAEQAGDDPQLREELAALGSGVVVTPAGNRLRVEVTDPQQRAQVAQVLARRGVTSRALPASLEDVYLRLTGQQVATEEDAAGVR